MNRLLPLAGAIFLAVIAIYQYSRPAPRAAGPQTAAKGVAAASRGQQVFDKWCAACHGRGPGHPGTQSLELRYKGDPPGALEDRTDLAPETTAAFVRHGFALMPPFRKTEISDADLAELSAYLAKKR
ncbi:c-type cytochrome [Sphingomonas canadensis]|uniref:C-type cytochrome n=1 Tax=Sphingomonas canadensis TaxID=1219257 RepID=A0ABW3HBT7_9SPHN|nr:cytochrome c [Sphingomonas canadensis]MCW3838242.1 cytochrome c [Sphingomonas canadensis]